MSATVLERDMLKTAVQERGLDVTTYLNGSSRAEPCPWSAVWAGCGRGTRLLWLHFWRGPTTPGGLAEAHESLVERVRRGAIPAQAQEDADALPLRWLARLGARHAAPGESD